MSKGYNILDKRSDILFQSFAYIMEPNTHQSECHAGQQFSLEICGPGHCWPHRHSAQSLGDVAACCWRSLLVPDNRFLLSFLTQFFYFYLKQHTVFTQITVLCIAYVILSSGVALKHGVRIWSILIVDSLNLTEKWSRHW